MSDGSSERNPSTSGTSQSAARDKYNVCTPERVGQPRPDVVVCIPQFGRAEWKMIWSLVDTNKPTIQDHVEAADKLEAERSGR
ncbi:hypothetical protein ABG067_007098 [Albugo candida]